MYSVLSVRRRDVSKSGGLAMCLGVPMLVKSIDGVSAVCEADGVERDVSLFMLADEDVAPGDYVVVHVGYAIQKMTEADAHSFFELYDEYLRGDGVGQGSETSKER